MASSSVGSHELLVDPGVRLRRLDAARQRDLIREKLACFPEQVPLARRQLRLGAFGGSVHSRCALSRMSSASSTAPPPVSFACESLRRLSQGPALTAGSAPSV